jgi:hypothetical protein
MSTNEENVDLNPTVKSIRSLPPLKDPNSIYISIVYVIKVETIIWFAGYDQDQLIHHVTKELMNANLPGPDGSLATKHVAFVGICDAGIILYDMLRKGINVLEEYAKKEDAKWCPPDGYKFICGWRERRTKDVDFVYSSSGFPIDMTRYPEWLAHIVNEMKLVLKQNSYTEVQYEHHLKLMCIHCHTNQCLYWACGLNTMTTCNQLFETILASEQIFQPVLGCAGQKFTVGVVACKPVGNSRKAILKYIHNAWPEPKKQLCIWIQKFSVTPVILLHPDDDDDAKEKEEEEEARPRKRQKTSSSSTMSELAALQRELAQKQSEVSEKMAQLTTCCICMDKSQNRAVNPCGHRFCEACIDKHQETKKDCPTCRTIIQNVIKLF